MHTHARPFPAPTHPRGYPGRGGVAVSAVVAIIPARNEAATVAGVVAAVRAAGLPAIVVDDASTDATGEAAYAAGASVLRTPRSRGKGAAMAAGLAQAPDAQTVLFLDADLRGLGPHHLRALLAPVAQGAGQSVGILDRAPGGIRGGQRAVRAEVARGAGLAQAGWGDEVALNQAVRRAGLATVPVRLAGASAPVQERKRGLLRGAVTHLHQAWDIAGVALGPGVPVWQSSLPGVIASGAQGAQGLAQAGPTFSVQVVGPRGVQTVPALWDTGSEVTSVDAALLQALGATPTGSEPVSTVQGTSGLATYTAAVNAGGYPLSGGPLTVLGDHLPWPGPRVLVGRDIASMYVLTVDGPAGTWAVYGGGATARTTARSLAPLALAALVGGGVVATMVLLEDYRRTG